MSASAEHISLIAADMRDEDRFEVWASDRHTPMQALEISLSSSELAWTCLIDSTPAFMWGVARIGSMISEKGAPWLLGTNLFKDSKFLHREFIRQSVKYIDRMQERFPRLENYIHAENKLSMRWLRWCNFKTDMGSPAMINGETFYLFWRGKICVHQR